MARLYHSHSLEISVLENLESLTQLKDLQVGNNQISSIGHALNNNVALEELNLSGNKLSSFREILYLTRLPKLKSLCLSDPNFADNPICSLCNYQTHVVYHLPMLESLDTLDVTEESRKMISATVLKKRMCVVYAPNSTDRYYNMRIRTIKRNTNYLVKMIDDSATENREKISLDIKGLLEKSKKTAKKMDDLDMLSRKFGKEMVNDFYAYENRTHRMRRLYQRQKPRLKN